MLFYDLNIKEDILKIDNYTVAMNAQYYNLQFESQEATVSNSSNEFENDESLDVKKVVVSQDNLNKVNDQLSLELSKVLLKNINGESRRLLGDRIEISATYVEAQALNFSVDALVKADGKEIALSLDVSLSRSFVQQTKITRNLVERPLQDPLVISLDGTMPSLSSKTFAFDIDSDGESDQISMLNRGNGFLALDKNSNGQIDDGNELFGTKSGDGFADLKEYDDDANGWIDENDAIFEKLRVWKKSEGKDELIALGEVGIGAIFLGSTQTPFSLKSQTNQLLGEMRKSGFVLFESGKAGVISQVDLAVSSETKEGLNIFDDLQKNLSSLRLESLYRPDSDKKSESGNEKIDSIQAKIRELESKLNNAPDGQKASIQTQIGALFAQLMMVLEAQISA